MKVLNAQEMKERGRLIGQLWSRHDELNAAVAAFNAAIEWERKAVETALERYNAAVDEAEAFRDGVYTRMSDYYDDRSDAWYESEAGDAFYVWMNEWCGELTGTDIDFPDPIEEPDCDALDALSSLPEGV